MNDEKVDGVTELGELMDELEREAHDCAFTQARSDVELPHTKAYLAARQSVVQLFTRLSEERDDADAAAKRWFGESDRITHEMERLEGELAALREERDAWEEFAQHQVWCRYCGEDGVPQCSIGAPLQEKTDALLALRLLSGSKQVASLEAQVLTPDHAKTILKVFRDSGIEPCPLEQQPPGTLYHILLTLAASSRLSGKQEP